LECSLLNTNSRSIQKSPPSRVQNHPRRSQKIEGTHDRLLRQRGHPQFKGIHRPHAHLQLEQAKKQREKAIIRRGKFEDSVGNIEIKEGKIRSDGIVTAFRDVEAEIRVTFARAEIKNPGCPREEQIGKGNNSE
jgi:hypothetical protein